MIAILCDRLVARPEGAEGRFKLTAQVDLLNRPYLDRLAARYRRLGAREVMWAGPPADVPRQIDSFNACSWSLLDSPRIRRSAARHGEAVLIADFHLWPGDEIIRELRSHSHFLLALTAPVRGLDTEGYSEVIEPVAGPAGCTVTRRYDHTQGAETSRLPAAMIVRPRALGSMWPDLLDALTARDQSRIGVFVSAARQEAVRRPMWVESADEYLSLSRRLLSEEDVHDLDARLIGGRAWALPGAIVDRRSIVEGPVLFGRNCRVGRGARVVGPTVIGHSTRIGDDCFVGESVVMEGCTVGRGTRTWRSVIGPGRDIGQGKGISFAWVGEHCAPERLEVASEPRFASVVLPSRRSLRGCNHRLFPVIKRAMDICGALVGLVLTLPLYPFIAIAIKVTSPGSVFYVHRRQTVRGKEFGCLKFRSMLDHAHELQKELPNEVDGPQFHMENDPRLTRVGRFLRRTNLDEVPQFWNVLLGQMSLVGPRPSPDEENRYCPAWREARLSVRPGLTGMWQIRRSCDRSVGDFHEWIEYDIRYLRECSLRTDLSLLCRTLWQMAKRFCRVVDGVVPFASSRAARRDRPRRAVRMRCEKTAADALINRRQYDNR